MDSCSCDSPDPRQRPESPLPAKEGFGALKTPFSCRPYTGWKRGGLSVKNFPIFHIFLAEKKGDVLIENSRDEGTLGFS